MGIAFQRVTSFFHLLNMQKSLFYFPSDIADMANKYQGLLTSDEGAQYDEVIEINLDEVSVIICLCAVSLEHVSVKK